MLSPLSRAGCLQAEFFSELVILHQMLRSDYNWSSQKWNSIWRALGKKYMLDFKISCNFLFFEPCSEKLFLNECQMAFRVMERKWALSYYLNYGMKEAFYFTLVNVKC